jgi:1-acyl-sn-glycerol-3-phosphate acyltransferase
MLLEHYGVPVVPVCIHGSYEAMPVGKRLPRFRRLTVVFSFRLDPRELDREGAGDTSYERITNTLRDHVAELCGKGPNRV